MPSPKNEFLQMKDPDSAMRSDLEDYGREWMKQHPGITVTMSDLMRMTMREGLNSLRSRKPRLGDKQRAGSLRK